MDNSFKVGDVVEMHDGIPDQRIVAVYPMNNILSPDRVDVVDATNEIADNTGCIGIPISWIKRRK